MKDTSIVNTKDRIEKYIAKIEPLPEGGRNAGLYHALCCFLRAFKDDLSPEQFRQYALNIAADKCCPPLPDIEVEGVIESVLKADITPNATRPALRATKPPVNRSHIVPAVPVHAPTEHYLTASADSRPVAEILQKSVSIYGNALSKSPKHQKSIGDVLESFRTPNIDSRQTIERIRTETDKDKRNELKKKLQAVVFASEPQQQRKREFCKANGILCIDFDNIDNIGEAKETITKVDYIFAVGLSASGKGLFALAAYQDAPNLKTLLTAMQADFPYQIDEVCSDVSRLRFWTLDENLIVKDDVFPAILHERTGEPATRRGNDVSKTGNEHLDRLIAAIEPIDWTQYQINNKPPTRLNYRVETVDAIKDTARKNETPLVCKNGVIYLFTGTHYNPLNEGEFKTLLREAAIVAGVPRNIARDKNFIGDLYPQFLLDSADYSVSEPKGAFINLHNGTLYFDKSEPRFEKHTSAVFIRNCLSFDYDEAADCPLWMQHLNRALPSQEKQDYLAECLALPFYKGKIEKAPILYGQRDTGKSTTLDVFKALLGSENIVSETLVSLTKTDYTGDYARARLDGKLVNVAADISRKISDEGLTKTLISRETVSARRPNKEGFDMSGYARLIFAMNELPTVFFTDAALTKRAAIIEFDQQIRDNQKDTDFAERIIVTELSGVLNWIIAGLKRLMAKGRLDEPAECRKAIERIRIEADPLSGWLDEKGYVQGDSENVALKDAYDDYCGYCQENGNQRPSKKTFSARLRSAGFTVKSLNGHTGTTLLFSLPNFHSPRSPHSPLLENKSENGELSGNEIIEGNETGNEIIDQSESFPVETPVKQVSGNEGNEGKHFSGESGDLSEGIAVENINEALNGGEAVKFDELTDGLFRGDRVPARDFLNRHGFVVDNNGNIIRKRNEDESENQTGTKGNS